MGQIYGSNVLGTAWTKEEILARQRFAIARVKAAGTVVEVCPTSNMRIGNVAEEQWHSVHRFAAEGLDFVVCSDDPGLFGVTLPSEIEWVSKATEIASDFLAARSVEHWRRTFPRVHGVVPTHQMGSNS